MTPFMPQMTPHSPPSSQTYSLQPLPLLTNLALLAIPPLSKLKMHRRSPHHGRDSNNSNFSLP